MKKLKYIKLLIYTSFSLIFSTNAQAFLLEQHELKSKDGTCKIHYLSEKNTKGWHFVPEQTKCGEDGFLDGFHRITIYNAFLTPIEKLSGYFSKGYWTKDAWVTMPFLTRTSEELGVQKATYLMYRDELRGIDYMGQMTAQKGPDGSYSAFNVCQPLKLLAVTTQIPTFANPRMRQVIFKEIEKQARRLCPITQEVHLFVSPVVAPEQSDIVFFSRINLLKHTEESIWRHEALEKAGFSSKTIELSGMPDHINENLKEESLAEIRKKLSQKIMELNQKTAQTNAYDAFSQTEEDNFESADIQTYDDNNYTFETENTAEPIENLELLNTNEELTQEFIEKEPVEETPKKQETQPLAEQTNKIPEPQKSYSYKATKNTTPIAEALVLAKVKNEEIKISTPIYVDSPNKNETIASLPLPLKIKDMHLEKGWHLITGYLKAYPTNNVLSGEIQIISADKCQSSWCEKEF